MFVVACPVISGAAPTLGLAAAHVVDMALSTVDLTPAVSAEDRVRFDSVPHSCSLDACLEYTLCNIAPLYDKHYL